MHANSKVKQSPLKALFRKYQSLISYAFFGVCTTVVNVAVYYFASNLLHLSIIASTVIAWILSVLFAYLTNRKWVFDSKAKGTKAVIAELIAFINCRLLTGALDLGIMYIFAEKLQFDEMLVKITSNVLVIIANYILSKLVIFTDQKRGGLIKPLAILATLFIASFMIAETSQLAPWKDQDTPIDWSVFKYVASEMEQGAMPYRDTFDHKGPLLYFINLAGNRIASWRGVWVFDFASIFITAFFVYLTAKLVAKSDQIALIVTAVALTALIPLYEMGGYAQVYALPCIAISVYLFNKHLILREASNLELIIIGLCLGAAAMLQANIVLIWLAIAAIVIYDAIKHGRANRIARYMIFVALGAAIVVLPIFAWLYFSDAFAAFWDCYIRFNAAYSAETRLENSLHATTFFFTESPILLLGFVLSVYLAITRKKRDDIYSFALIAVAILVAAMSGRPYHHYAMIAAPLLALPFASLLLDYPNKTRNLIAIATLLTLAPFWNELTGDALNNYINRAYSRRDATVSQIADLIISETTPNDRISVYGNWDIIYLRSGRRSASRYSFQYAPAIVDPQIFDDYLAELKLNPPKIVVIEPQNFTAGHGYPTDKTFYSFLEDYHYQLIWLDSVDNGGARVYKLSN